jgi:hypothetical protein
MEGRTIVRGIPAPSLTTTASDKAFVNVNVFGVALGFVSPNKSGSICKMKEIKILLKLNDEGFIFTLAKNSSESVWVIEMIVSGSYGGG